MHVCALYIDRGYFLRTESKTKMFLNVVFPRRRWNYNKYSLLFLMSQPLIGVRSIIMCAASFSLVLFWYSKSNQKNKTTQTTTFLPILSMWCHFLCQSSATCPLFAKLESPSISIIWTHREYTKFFTLLLIVVVFCIGDATFCILKII